MTDPLGLINRAGGAGGAVGGSPLGKAGGNQQGPSFKDVLMKSIDQVNKLQQDAQAAVEDLASGKRDDVDAVFIAQKKADLAFQTLVQVRNKLASAYEEIKQIRV